MSNNYDVLLHMNKESQKAFTQKYMTKQIDLIVVHITGKKTMENWDCNAT